MQWHTTAPLIDFKSVQKVYYNTTNYIEIHISRYI